MVFMVVMLVMVVVVRMAVVVNMVVMVVRRREDRTQEDRRPNGISHQKFPLFWSTSLYDVVTTVCLRLYLTVSACYQFWIQIQFKQTSLLRYPY